jgi:hypothetical protein
MKLIIGQYIENIKCESFLDKETNRVRIRPLSDQIVPSTLLIECLKIYREQYPLGTTFVSKNVKVCKKKNGRVYLRSEGQLLEKMTE